MSLLADAAPALEAERLALLSDAMVLDPIASNADYLSVASMEARLAAFIAKAEPIFDEHVADARKVWTGACDLRKKFLDPAKELRKQCGAMLLDYRERQDEARRLEEARLNEAQRDVAIEARDREAEHYEALGQAEIADAVRAAPVDAGVVVLPDAVPRVDGLTFRTEWKWRAVNDDRTRAAILMTRDGYAGLLKLDDAALNAFAKRTKGAVEIPGIEFYRESGLTRRGAK